MSKVFLIGYNPPQLMGSAKIEAAHYRTWHFLQPLLDDGHEVCLCAGAVGEPPIERPFIPPEWAAHLQYVSVHFGQTGWQQTLQRAHDQFIPDCIVAVNFSHCLYATKLRTDKPIWMDIYGDMITIMQAASFRLQSDRGMTTLIGFMQRVLQVGDAFSGCGIPQKHALVGELAMTGRLNRRTFGFEFAHVVLPGAPPPRLSQIPAKQHRTFLKELGVEDDDFVLLWCGGYNTWTDVETLFAGLEWAMSRNPKIRYVSVGSSTYGLPGSVYEQFGQMVAQSPYRERYHLMGWQPWNEIPKYYQESDAGFNIDALHYETLYGTRTRLVEMIAAGLPVITSLGSELSYLLQANEAALAFAVGDWQCLGDQILTLAQDETYRRQMAAKALQYATQDLSFYETTAPLRAWVQNPQKAPDHVNQNFQDRVKTWEYRGRALLRQIIWQLFGLEK